jgi:hypothetical protein
MLSKGDAAKHTVFVLFLLVFIALSIYNFVNRSQWLFDNLVAIAFLIFVFSIYRWLMLSWRTYLMFNLALLTHNLGSFGFYEFGSGFFAYDAIVHLFGAMVAAYIIFNFASRRLHVKRKRRVKRTVVDEHKVIFIFLVMASVAMLGTIVELIEFGGFMFLGPGEGMFFTGYGDSGYDASDFRAQYVDTMEDIIVNIIGSMIGVLAFYIIRYRQRYLL